MDFKRSTEFNKHNFNQVLFIMLYEVVLTFKSADETLV